MNNKTAKLLNRYSKQSGLILKNLKKEWYSLNVNEKFKKRQEIIQKLKV